METARPPRLLTAEDLLAPGNPYERCELWDGSAVVREPAGGWSNEVASRILGPLGMVVRSRSLGWVPSSEQGYLVGRDPDRLLAPDASFVSKERLPRIPAYGFIEMAPDFAVEVRSSTDAWVATIERASLWIAHGSAVVWAVDPLAKTVVVFRGLSPPEECGPGATVTAAPVLPEFRLAVSDLFEGLE